ncbi:MAG: tetratricopeptide repeat protein [Candidatus Binatia bacterium]
MTRTLLTALLLLAGCATRPPAHDHAPATAAAPPPLYDNLGSHTHTVSCSAAAQAYFDQGLRLIYAFNHDEAQRSFEEAARLDPNCAMAFWGEALALGPNINLPIDAPRGAAAQIAITQAVALAPHASAKEQAYIAALAKRYSADASADRKAHDRAYAEAMRDVARTYPDDTDAATLYAESMMDLRPWDLWAADGTPYPGTVEIVTTLEAVMIRDPNHPGANHYYIHAIEQSQQPEKGLPSAQRLPGLVPGAGHLVHMPSHIYMRTGRYSDAAVANQRAIVVDEQYLAAAQPTGVYPMMYYPHNIHFLWAAASMEGRSADAIGAARLLGTKVPPEMAREMPMVEYFMPTTYFALLRFGQWDAMLAEPAPPPDLLYLTAMWHYARGIAFAAQGRSGQADAELAAFEHVAAHIPPDRIVGDNQPAGGLLHLAAIALRGDIAARQGHFARAVPLLEEAVRLQDALPYMEPPPWYFPQRQALGAALLAAGKPAQAEAVYREDLRLNPNNGWSLFGLAESLRAQRKTKDAAEVEAQFKTAWTRADVTLNASRF